MDFRLISLISLRQVNGRRYIAVTSADKRRYAADPTVIDAIKPLGCVDVPRYGHPEWGAVGPRSRDIAADVRKVLEQRLREALDADGETYDPPAGFGPNDEWDVAEDDVR